MITYPFPLRQGLFVTLVLPPDLTKEEAQRLGVFIESLVTDSEPKGPEL